ncbi:hypothetical protein FRC01_003379 [Tulasnella sp. 417]|nr:hypothetical protein FRC01_003379 [Tulasnella sp. 417]
MDLSLSLKADEKARKRDLLIQFVQKFVKTPSKAGRPSPAGTDSSSSAKDSSKLLAPSPLPAIRVHHIETPRSQSVPPGSPFSGGLHPLDVTDAPKRRIYSQVYSTESLSRENGAPIINVLVLFDSDIPQDGAGALDPDSSVRGRDLFQKSLLPTGADNGPENITLGEGAVIGSRLSEDTGATKDRSDRDRLEAYIKAVFNTTIPSNHHTKYEQKTSPLSGPSADPISPARGSIRWPSKGSGLLDGLRRFTSVDVLEGENAFACKFCWEESQRRRHQTVKGSNEFGESDVNLNGNNGLSMLTAMQTDTKEQPPDPSSNNFQARNQPPQAQPEPAFGETGTSSSRQDKVCRNTRRIRTTLGFEYPEYGSGYRKEANIL